MSDLAPGAAKVTLNRNGRDARLAFHSWFIAGGNLRPPYIFSGRQSARASNCYRSRHSCIGITDGLKLHRNGSSTNCSVTLFCPVTRIVFRLKNEFAAVRQGPRLLKSSRSRRTPYIDVVHVSGRRFFLFILLFVPSRQKCDDELLMVGLWRRDFPVRWFLSHLASALRMLAFIKFYRAGADDRSRIKSSDYPIRLHPDGCDRRDGGPAN